MTSGRTKKIPDPRMDLFGRRSFLKIAGQIMGSMGLLGNWNIFPEKKDDQDVSLIEKIGQMLMVGFRGLHIDKNHSIAQDILVRHIGGVVLFDYDVPDKSPVRNIQSPQQLKALVHSLQSLSPDSLLIAIDQEGGRITRLKEKFGFPPTMSAQNLGTKNDPEFSHEQASKMAKQLAELGINLNLAPVVDLNIQPKNPIIGRLERSFSKDPILVTAHASKFIKAHHQEGILCALKHFPGHGSSTQDTHLGMVDVSESWSQQELEPYIRLIRAGQVDAIMTAHVYNKHLDPEFPATLSKQVIADLLRKKLNYDGVVISDDLQMGAIRNEYGLETAIHKSLEAGVDILAFANNSVYKADIAERALKIIENLIRKGQIKKSRIDVSYKRIRKLKGKLLTQVRR